MYNFHMPQAVAIYGPPGSGKGTQANLLAWTKNFIHFDTGKFFEQTINDPTRQDEPEVKEMREQFISGVLVNPTITLRLVAKKTKEIGESGFNIVYSGSPRTMFEAFGDEKSEGLVSVLEKLYGKENVQFVFLKIDPQVAIKRNANRKVCSLCATAILYNDSTHHHTECPLCGAKLRRRAVDNPEVLQTRIKEYEERTKPIVDELKKRGYKIHEVDGTPLPYVVFEGVKNAITNNE